MPVFNAEPFLQDCLNSILEQSFKDWELLVIDDGSSDNSLSLLREYARLDKRIKPIAQEKSGIIPALQIGIAQATGELICRMDADDRMPEHKLLWMEQALHEKGKGYLATGKVTYFSEQPLGNGYLQYANWLNNLVDHQDQFQNIYRECVIPSCAWMLHREDFDLCGGFNSDQYPEDYDLCFRFYKHNFKILNLDKVMHFWRDHPGRSSRNDPNYLDNQFINIKLQYFIDIELKKGDKITLWGAGKKGKVLAQILIEKEIDFDWLTNNERKVGVAIYGKTLKVIDLSSTSILQQKIILAIAGPDDQKQIEHQLETLGLVHGKSFFFFA